MLAKPVVFVYVFVYVFVIRYSHSLFVTVGEIKNGKTLLVCCSAASLSLSLLLSLSLSLFVCGAISNWLLHGTCRSTPTYYSYLCVCVCVLTYVCARICAYCLPRHNAKMRVTSFLKPNINSGICTCVCPTVPVCVCMCVSVCLPVYLPH